MAGHHHGHPVNVSGVDQSVGSIAHLFSHKETCPAVKCGDPKLDLTPFLSCVSSDVPF